MNIAIQGERGSFHHVAAMKQYGNAITLVPCENFASVFQALDGSVADAAIIAVENSLYGSINEVYDLLLRYQFQIVAEIPERVHQCLVGHPHTPLEQISHIYSHPVALAQCSQFLVRELGHAERVEYFDTAGAARLISEKQDYTGAAIASAFAAELFGLSVLADNIENHAMNYTRFLAIERNPKSVPGANKASLVLHISHQPGSLYHALGVFADRDISLTKLQSRPVPGKVWRYMFYVDVLMQPSMIPEITAVLESQSCDVQLLGTYKAHQDIQNDH